MKVKPPENPNYAATVVNIQKIITLDNCDNVVATPVLGYQAIVGKSTQPGDTCLVFPPECQLSDEFCRENNLYRHSELNRDTDVKGYFEDNRRVRAQNFRGHQSDAFVIPLSSLSYLGDVDKLDLWPGDTFDEINGHEVCRKYFRKSSLSAAPIRPTRVDDRFFPKHFDTENYFKNEHSFFDMADWLIVTQKLHGTSIRVGNVLVRRKLSWREKVAKFFGAKIEEFEYDYVYGSRNIIKDPNNPNQSHYYEHDIWTLYGKATLNGLIPKGFMVYGELIGWTPDNQPIQSGYTYNIPRGYARLYVYRVSFVNPDGREFDLSWELVKEFCDSIGVNYVPEISAGWHLDLKQRIPDMLDKRLKDTWFAGIEVDEGKVDEGVCVRRDGIRPLILKAKSAKFLEHETKMFDKEVIDIEGDA